MYSYSKLNSDWDVILLACVIATFKINQIEVTQEVTEYGQINFLHNYRYTDLLDHQKSPT